MASKDVQSMERGELIAAISESGIPFDAGSHIDQLRATVSRLPLLVEEHNRRAQAEAGADVPPVSVDPGPDPETGYVKQRGEVGTNSDTASVDVELPPARVPPAQLAENAREGAQTDLQPKDPQAGQPPNPSGGTVQQPAPPSSDQPSPTQAEQDQQAQARRQAEQVQADQLRNQTLEQLRDTARARGVSPSGSKDELVRRLSSGQ